MRLGSKTLFFMILACSGCEPEEPRVRKGTGSATGTGTATATATSTGTSSPATDISITAAKLHVALRNLYQTRIAVDSPIGIDRTLACDSGTGRARLYNGLLNEAAPSTEAAEYLALALTDCASPLGDGGVFVMTGDVLVRRTVNAEQASTWEYLPDGLTVAARAEDGSEEEVLTGCSGRLAVTTTDGTVNGDLCGQLAGSGVAESLAGLAGDDIVAAIGRYVPDGASPAPAGLTGTWKSTDPCFVGLTDEWTIDDAGATHKVVSHDDQTTCKIPQLTTQTLYRHAARGASTLGDDSLALDLLEVSVRYTPHTPGAATALSGQKACDRTDWAAGVPQECLLGKGLVSYRTYKLGGSPPVLTLSDDSQDPAARKTAGNQYTAP